MKREQNILREGLNVISLGAGITYATGNPGFSGLITGFTTSFVFYILYRITNKFGAIAIAFTIYSILAIPTVLLGAPGIYKIAVGLLSGLAFDIVLRIFNYKFKGFIIGFLIFVVVMIPLTYYSYVYFALPNLEKFRSMIFILAGIFIIEGWIAAFFAKAFYDKRLKNLTTVKNISLVDTNNHND
jgi:membrane-associated HD superfamily phosphohydrolase